MRAAFWLALLCLTVAGAAQADAYNSVSNGVYRALMGTASDPTIGGGLATGQWSAMTDAGFGTPAQNGKSILYDAAAQENAFASMENEFSVRSYTSNTVYAQNGNTLVGETFAVNQLSSAAYSPTLTVSGNTLSARFTVLSPDSLTIWHNITTGSNSLPATSANSWIQDKIRVCNNGATAVNIGLRSHWDLMVAGNDLNDKAWVTSYSPLTVGPYDATPQDVTDFSSKYAFKTRDPPETFTVYGLLRDPSPSPFPDPVVQPDRFVYTRWTGANYAWGYSVAGGSMYSDADPDSSVIYFWGPSTGTPVPAGSCYQVQTYITLDLTQIQPPPPPPPNQPPTVSVAGSSPGTCMDSSWTFTAVASDPGDDGLGGNSGTVTTLTWNFGDGTPLVSGPPGSTSTVGHLYPNPGPYTVTVTATDNGGLSQVATMIVQSIGEPDCCPTFTPANQIQLVEGDVAVFQNTAQDPEGQTLTFSAVTLPPGATYTSTGAFQWQTREGDRGTHTFTLAATDAAGCTVTAQHRIQVLAPLSTVPDRDQDGIADDQDNCPDDFNPNQRDDDRNGIGWVCDLREQDATGSAPDNPLESRMDAAHPGCVDCTDQVPTSALCPDCLYAPALEAGGVACDACSPTPVTHQATGPSRSGIALGFAVAALAGTGIVVWAHKRT